MMGHRAHVYTCVGGHINEDEIKETFERTIFRVGLRFLIGGNNKIISVKLLTEFINFIGLFFLLFS